MTEESKSYIGIRIKLGRDMAGFTQKVLGEKVGVSDTTIRRWERGVIPDSASLIKIAKALDTPVEYFFRGKPIELTRIT